MPLEIEAKVRLHDVSATQAALRDCGGQLVRTIIEINTFFDTPDGDLKSRDHGLRVRREHELDGPYHKVIITHKGPRARGRLKSRNETEVAVDNANDAGELLVALGYLRVLSFEKKRQVWTMDGCSIAIDSLPHVGDFLEVEGPGDEAVLSVIEKLGLSKLPILRASYIAMLQTWLAENQIHSTHIRLVDNEQPAASR